MKSSSSSDLQRFMLIPTKFPLSREGGFAMSTVAMKMVGDSGQLLSVQEAMTIAVFISIICRVREIVWTTIGMLLMKIGTRVSCKSSR